ncbi:hypothetical protein QQF64_005253 [Cirrhinus molitorella]|uniref:4-hydroxyphenylpyruvate dioxygenase n=1 Tax=Cirrhinus molitorella TaxID=172907 RepID=A0ABR3MIM0_9TELE
MTINGVISCAQCRHLKAYLSPIAFSAPNVDKVAHELVSRFQFNVFARSRWVSAHTLIIRSPVGNVCHTLIDRSQYQGLFLPGFHQVGSDSQTAGRSQCPITHFDHITYACPRSSTAHITRWYHNTFGFQRFFIDRNEDVDEGYVLNHDGIGLRLTAMEYWKCSESGITLPFKDEKEPDCKFVIAESLPEQGRNQVDTFLDQHRGAGIQHIGLYTEDIVRTAQTLSQAGVQFFSPPPAYYTEVGKQEEIVAAGHDPHILSQYGILLDTDIHRDTDNQRYLLQVFTKPIFGEDTFFLELIERRGATGFGEGNIRALWRSVQAYMENEEHDETERDAPLAVPLKSVRYRCGSDRMGSALHLNDELH